MKGLTLRLREVPKTGLEVEAILPENFVGKTLDDISNILVFLGNKRRKISDFFELTGEIAKDVEEQRIVLDGDLSRVKRIGESMNGGEIFINGSVGIHLGEFMHGGKITVAGNARSWVGTSMTGGEIMIDGNARDYIGCGRRGENKGMKEGRITINGNAGTEIGSYIAGGEILIKGRADSFVGSYARGGKITVGEVSKNRIGYSMKKGGIFVLDSDFEIPFNFKHLADKENFSIYQGDLSIDGKGLIYVSRRSEIH